MPGKSNVAPWSVKGVERPTRDLARTSAQAAGQTVGSWIEQAIRAHATLLQPAAATPETDPMADVVAATQRAEVRSLEAGVERTETISSDMVIPVALKVQQLAHRLVEIEQARVAGRTRPAPEPPPPPPEPDLPFEAFLQPEPEPEPEPVRPAGRAPAQQPVVEDFPTPVPPPDDRLREPEPEPESFVFPPETAIPEPEERPHRRSWAKPRPKAKPQRSRFRRVVGRAFAALLALTLGAGSSILVLDHGELIGLPPRLVDDVAVGVDRAIVEGRDLLAQGEVLAERWIAEIRSQFVDATPEEPAAPEKTAVALDPTPPPPPPPLAAPPLSTPPVAALPQAEPPKAEPPKVEAPTTEMAKVDPSKAEPLKVDAPKTEAAPPPQTGSLPIPSTAPTPTKPATPPAVTPGTTPAQPAERASDFPTLNQPTETAPTAREAEDLEKIARQGDVKAQYELGVLAAQPETGAPEYGKAAYWFREAAVQGNASAQYNLGVLYEHGLGVGQDDVRALLWYHSAAEQGHARAQYNLGVFYAQGRGIPTDYGEAQRWFKKAADQGIAKAFYNLAILAESGLGGPANPVAARAFMSRAALLGDADARAALAKRPAPKPDPSRNGDPAKPSTEVIGAVQHMLTELGYDAGRIDGVVGDKTRQAIRKFQGDNGVPQTGTASEELLELLTAKLGPAMSPTARR